MVFHRRPERASDETNTAPRAIPCGLSRNQVPSSGLDYWPSVLSGTIMPFIPYQRVVHGGQVAEELFGSR